MLRQFSVRTLQCFIAGMLLGVIFMPDTANGVVVYREIFPNDTGANLTIASAEWQAYWSATAVEVGTFSSLIAGGVTGIPVDATAVNSNPASSELANGYFYVHTSETTNRRDLVFTAESGLIDQAIATAQLSEVSWYAGNETTTAAMRVAVQVGADWYGSEQAFNNTNPVVSGLDFTTQGEFFTLNATTANWFPITFVPDTELSLNTSSSGTLPSGTVTGIGLYIEDSTVAAGLLGMRIDTFSVSTSGTPVVPGDFDNDGDVDGADFVVWQTNFPTAGGATLADGDADGDGDVDGADFVVWQTNFPTTPGPATAVVPEPHAVLLALIGASILVIRKYRPSGNARRESESTTFGLG